MASTEIPSQGASSSADTSDTPDPLKPSDRPQELVTQDTIDMTQETSAQTSTPAAETPFEPVLIGIYGIGGSGVEDLRGQLEAALGHDEYEYFGLLQDVLEIEQASGRPTPSQTDEELADLRDRRIAAIREQCRKTGKIGLVFSHRMLFSNDLKIPSGPVVKGHFWPVDASFARAFYYAAPPVAVVQTLRTDLRDVKFHRKKLTQKLVKSWDDNECDALRTSCHDQRVHMEVVRSEHGHQPTEDLVKQLVDMILINSQTNQQRVVSEVVKALNFETAPSNAVVLIEGHNVLASDVASTTPWGKMVSKLASWGATSAAATQRDTYRILRRMADRHLTDRDDQQVQMAKKVMTLDPELERLLWKLMVMRVPTVILTCGHKSVWEHVLGQPSKPEGVRYPWETSSGEQLPGLGDKFKVVGGGRAFDHSVVAPEDKAAVVRALRDKHGRRVCAIGGSELDVPMLKAAGRDAFILSPRVGELAPGVKALLREHGGQATRVGSQADAFDSDWQGDGNDIYDAMGLDVDDGEGQGQVQVGVDGDEVL